MFMLMFVIYVAVKGPDGESVRTYQGQSIEMIREGVRREGKTVRILTRAEYEAHLMKDRERINASRLKQTPKNVDFKDKSKSTDERLDALIKYLGL